MNVARIDPAGRRDDRPPAGHSVAGREPSLDEALGDKRLFDEFVGPYAALVHEADRGEGGCVSVVPPTSVRCNLHAEESVVGAVLFAGSLDVAAGHRVLDRVLRTGLLPEDFYVVSVGALFEQLVRMHLDGLPLDVVSVADRLEQAGAEPLVVGRLHRLAYLAPPFSAAAHHARIVLCHARQRRSEGTA